VSLAVFWGIEPIGAQVLQKIATNELRTPYCTRPIPLVKNGPGESRSHPNVFESYAVYQYKYREKYSVDRNQIRLYDFRTGREQIIHEVHRYGSFTRPVIWGNSWSTFIAFAALEDPYSYLKRLYLYEIKRSITNPNSGIELKSHLVENLPINRRLPEVRIWGGGYYNTEGPTLTWVMDQYGQQDIHFCRVYRNECAPGKSQLKTIHHQGRTTIAATHFIGNGQKLIWSENHFTQDDQMKLWDKKYSHYNTNQADTLFTDRSQAFDLTDHWMVFSLYNSEFQGPHSSKIGGIKLAVTVHSKKIISGYKVSEPSQFESIDLGAVMSRGLGVNGEQFVVWERHSFENENENVSKIMIRPLADIIHQANHQVLTIPFPQGTGSLGRVSVYGNTVVFDDSYPLHEPYSGNAGGRQVFVSRCYWRK
jgi:hypothetical protein